MRQAETVVSARCGIKAKIMTVWQKLKKTGWKEICLSYFPTAALVANLIIAAVFYALALAHFPTQNGDNIEHVHSSFMIAAGEVPYRDFFQHHNPLMWYLFAPLMKLFAYDATVVEVVCLISLIVFLKSLVYVYRISAEFLSNKFWGLAAAAAVALPEQKLFAIDFRPDNYMIFALTGGIYYLFLYLKEKKQRHLTVAFLWFLISFLFAQKAVFPLFCLGLCILYLWYKKDIETKALFQALGLPVLGMLGFVYYLYHYDMLALYYACNYTFNLNLVEGFDFNRIAVFSPLMVAWMCLGFAGVVAAVVSDNKYWKILAFLFVAEFMQRRLYFSPYIYYYWLLVYLAVLCGMPLLAKADVRSRFVGLIFVGFLSFFLAQSLQNHWQQYKKQPQRQYLPAVIARQINQCDYVFNGDGYMYNLFGKDPAYYWQLIGQLDIIGERTGIRPRPDINALIVRLKPKFIYGRSYFNKFSKESGRLEIVHYIDPEIINRYYDATGFGHVYRLKPEYDNRVCIKDKASGKWHYKD